MRETMLIYCREMMLKFGFIIIVLTACCAVCLFLPMPPEEKHSSVVLGLKYLVAAGFMVSALLYMVRLGFMAHGYWVWTHKSE